MITFVTYYIKFSKSIVKHIEDVFKDIGIGCGEKYRPYQLPFKLINAMFESVLQHHQNARLVLLTDETTEIELPEYIEVHRIPRETDKMEVEMLQAKTWALENLGGEGHVVFLDPDMIIRDNLEDIFDRIGDLFFTYKKLSSNQELLKSGKVHAHPINIGFIAVRDQSKLDVAKLFSNICEQFPSLYRKHYQYWIGLQDILRTLFYEKLLASEEAGTLEDLFFYHRWLKIAFLPAEIYNFQIREGVFIPKEAKVLHFKGILTKQAMLEYWEAIQSKS